MSYYIRQMVHLAQYLVSNSGRNGCVRTGVSNSPQAPDLLGGSSWPRFAWPAATVMVHAWAAMWVHIQAVI